MSFIDLMASDVWSSADIDNKVQALIRSRFSAQDELKASRLARTSSPSDSDTAFVASVDAWIAECVLEGRSARADMELLLQVLAMLDANTRLLQPEVEPQYDEDGQVTNQDELAADADQRMQAQQILDTASDDAKALFELRKPPIEPEIIAEEVPISDNTTLATEL